MIKSLFKDFFYGNTVCVVKFMNEIFKFITIIMSSTAEDTNRTKWTNSTRELQLHDESEGVAVTTHKSAFQPYRPIGKVLTNLQRGNTEATFCTAELTLSFNERAGQGELTAEQIRQEYQKNAADFKDELGFTPLHWAAYYGQLHIVQMLLDIARIDANIQAPEMVTPLLLAACAGHHEVVRLLLERGADPAHMDIMGNTALMYAAAGNHPHTCQELISRNNDIIVTNENGDTAYSLAIENGATLSQSVIEQFLITILLPI